MARIALSVVVVLVAVFGLLPGLPDATPAQADHTQMTGSRAATGAAMSGCGRGPGHQNVPASAIAELPRITIGIHDGFFLPAEISVQPGTIVVWRNLGSNPHTTTAWNRWDSGVLRPGEACMAWFVTPGSYDYLSIVAADGGTMTGTITVEGPPIGGASAGMGVGTGTGTMPMMPGMGTMGAGY